MNIIYSIKERVCEDSASAELSVTDTASAISEITYLLEEIRTKLEYEGTAFKPTSDHDDDFALETPSTSSPADNMPATLDELKEIMSKKRGNFLFRKEKNSICGLYRLIFKKI